MNKIFAKILMKMSNVQNLITYFSDHDKFIPVWFDRAATISRLRISSSSWAGFETDTVDDTTFNALSGLGAADVEGWDWEVCKT